MATPLSSHQLEISIPDPLYEWLSHEAQRRAQDLPAVIQSVLEHYAEDFELTRTRTWQLCGAYSVMQPAPEYVVGSDETGSTVTNYAEHVDAVLYR